MFLEGQRLAADDKKDVNMEENSGEVPFITGQDLVQKQVINQNNYSPYSHNPEV